MPNVDLPANTYVDLYAATGIVVGTQITVSNITSPSVNLYATAAQPLSDSDRFVVQYNSISAQNEAGDPGAWAFCGVGGAVDVKV